MSSAGGASRPPGTVGHPEPTAGPDEGADGGPQGPGGPSGAGLGGPGPAASGTVNVEELLGIVESLTAERDQAMLERDANLDARARLQAEFENYRKRSAKQELEQTARAHETLVNKLLPTLDAFDAAMAHGLEGLEPLQQALVGTLEREGLGKLVPTGQPFDPTEHEAVLHEEGGADEEHGVVVEVLRAGYAWKGRVIRPAMVKVRT